MCTLSKEQTAVYRSIDMTAANSEAQYGSPDQSQLGSGSVSGGNNDRIWGVSCTYDLSYLQMKSELSWVTTNSG